MARKNEPLESPEEGMSDFVPAVFARSAEEAEQFRELLDDHDIPAVVATDNEITGGEDSESRPAQLDRMTQQMAVLVPKVLLGEASQVIADFEDSADFQATGDEFDEDEQAEEDELSLQAEPADERLIASPDEKDEALDEADDFTPDES